MSFSFQEFVNKAQEGSQNQQNTEQGKVEYPLFTPNPPVTLSPSPVLAPSLPDIQFKSALCPSFCPSSSPSPGNTTGKIITTYSFWRKFLDCRMKAKFRQFDKLKPLTSDDNNLTFGTLIHNCLEIWHKTGNQKMVNTFIEEWYFEATAKHPENTKNKTNTMKAKAMMKGYVNRWKSDMNQFDTIHLEIPFLGDIINPRTGRPSKKVAFAGKIDGIIMQKINGKHYILEHKTTSSITSGYIDMLKMDRQSMLYSLAASDYLNIPIAGVLYNVLEKVSLKQKEGETKEEYQIRYAEACAKAKTGKSSAKRKMPETDEKYQERLYEAYDNPEKFYREELHFSEEQLHKMRQDLWQWVQELLLVKRNNTWYDNPSHCFDYQQPCEYWAICSSQYNPAVIENFYKKVEVNEELKKEDKVKLFIERMESLPANEQDNIIAMEDYREIREPAPDGFHYLGDQLVANF